MDDLIPGRSRRSNQKSLPARLPRCHAILPREAGQDTARRSMANAEGIRQHAAPVAEKTLHFPDSDGRFLPENHRQAEAIVSLRCDLQAHFYGPRDAFVGGNMFVYYDPSDANKSVSPDVFVVLDHDLGDRQTYKLWVEGKPPDFAVEVVSPSSRVRNRTDKKDLYARLGIGEYFLFQPDPGRPAPRLVGYELWGGKYLEMPSVNAPGGALEIRSERLGVSLRVEGERLRVRNLETGEDYAWHEDRQVRQIAAERARRAAEEQSRRDARARQAAEEQSRRDTQARQAAERRIAGLQAQLQRIDQKGVSEV